MAHPPGSNQLLDDGRHGIERGERIVPEPVFHRANHVREGIQADDVAGAEGRRFRTPKLAAGERIDRVEAQAELLRLGDDRQDREHTHTVRDEVRRVLGAHDSLAHRGGHESLEPIDNGRIGGNRRN